MKRAFVVLNPVSGTGDKDETEHLIKQHFTAQGWRHSIYRTTGHEKLYAIVEDARKEEFDLIVAAGGDGTVSGVASGMIHSDIPLGILPCGTGNALARDMDIPLTLPEALDVLTAAQAFQCVDALQVGERYYILNISMGASAQAMLDAEREHKRRFGILAYIWAGMRQLAGVQPHRFEVEIDGVQHTARASDVVVANSSIIGLSQLRLAPDIRLDDGRMDVCVIRTRSLWDYAQILWDILRLRQKRNSHVKFYKATESVTIADQQAQALPVQGDGEFIGRASVTVTLVPDAVRLVVGKRELP